MVTSNSLTQSTRFFALIPCAGAGLRAGGNVPKQYQNIAGKPMALHTLDAFTKVERVTQTLVVVSQDDSFFEALPLKPPLKVIVKNCGGAARSDTVFNGLQALMDAGATKNDWVLVHDAARCLVTPAQINRLMDEGIDDAVGGLLACPVADTLKASESDRALATVDRAEKWAAQTPQMFRIGVLQDALMQAKQRGLSVTDEASALEMIGLKPKLVTASSQNFKVTYPEDFALAEAILNMRGKKMMLNFRIGEGWDTHQLVDQVSTGRKLILGGVEIPFSKGLLGHSDADALCHAITDALLGAAALGDIGKHFPDTDPRHKGADSIALLKHTTELVRQNGWQICNVDSTVVAEAPKLAPYMDTIRKNLSIALGLEISQVNVKAKTAEKLGPVGEGLSIEARAVVMINCLTGS